MTMARIDEVGGVLKIKLFTNRKPLNCGEQGLWCRQEDIFSI
jgi:hypothetical protein